MRAIKFKKYIKKEWILQPDKRIKVPKIGTGKMEDDFTHKGIFHRWGLNIEDGENNPASYSVAIVEKEDGSIVLLHPENMKFDD